MREIAYRAKRIGGSWLEHGLRYVSLCQLISPLDGSLFGKFEEVYLSEAEMLSFDVNLSGG